MRAHLVGGGISSLSAAAFLIKDGGLLGANIHIYESGPLLGGALDAGGTPERGYTMRGGRMFETQDRCLHALLSAIPSARDPTRSIEDEITAYHAAHGWRDRARLVARGGRIVDARRFELSRRNLRDLIALALTPESALDGKTIAECIDLSILHTNFWSMFGSIFAFMPWHGAAEMRRYLLRFLHLLPDMAAMTGIQRTPQNQYESIVLPLADWLRRLGVQIHTGTTVTDIDFVPSGLDITARRIHLAGAGEARTIELAATDLVFVTNGSHVAAPARGSMASAPPPPSPTRDVSWQLWERLARKHDEFGRPAAFNANAAATSWTTFTVTSRGSQFVDLLKDLTGSAEGRGGLITLTDSNWLVTIVTLRNPHFAGQPENVHVWWGYGLYLDRPGNFVPKPMPACTGAEILDETVRHLGFDADLESIVESSICIPCLLPYAASCLLPRSAGDRPPVVPRRSTNLAFIGQFAEIPDEAAFTTEYAVRTAQTAVAILLKRDMPPPVYKGQFDPGVLLAAARALRS